VPDKEQAMSEPAFDLKRDGLGIALFALGAFFAVLGVVALFGSSGGAPIAQGTGSAALANGWLAGIGALPGIVVSAGVAFLGARMWLAARTENLVRNLLAFVGLGLALAVLCGAFSETAGGRFGYATGGLVSETAHPAVGALAGLIALAAAVWFGWLRPARLERDEPTIVRNPDALAIADVDDGVSAAEAAALIPEDFHRPLDAGRKQPAAQPKPFVPPASPYPEDVRLRGEIPAGARPLATNQNARADLQSPPEPAAVYRWTAPRADEPVAARADLAAVDEVQAAFDAEPATEPVETRAETRPALKPTARDADRADVEAETVERIVEVLPLAPPAPPPQPSWEQSDLFVEDEEPPVDAYGTPLTLVEELRRSQKEVARAFAQGGDLVAERVDDDVDGARQFAGVLEIDADEVEKDEALEDDLDEQDLDDEEDDLEDEEGSDDEDLEEAAEFDEDEVDEESDLDEEGDEDEEPLVAAASARDEDEESLVAVGSQEDEDEEPTALPGAIRAEEEEPRSTVAQEENAVDERPVSAKSKPRGRRTDSEAVRAEDAEAELDPAHAGPTASESEREITPVAPPARQPTAVKAGPERDVVLKPQAASAERATKAPAASGARNPLLVEAGCLFVERGRVAVSMLQRQYGMDFDDACKVLDELQELGLIGPYLGGQRRDILLTREQWLERVAQV
jgi:hypothetical protein